MKISKRIRTMLLCLLAMIMLLPTQVLAAGKIDVDGDVSLTIAYSVDKKAVEGVNFDLYYVADVSSYAEFSLAGDFAGYSVILEDDWDSAGWDSLALTLSGRAQADKIVPLASGMTNSNGELIFSSKSLNMKPGLYLVIGKSYIEDKYVYTPNSFMVSIPGMDMDTNEWVYDVTVNPKVQSVKRDDLIDLKVLKVWNDKGYTYRRPENITVQLLQDGEVYDTATLDAEDEWRHTWTELKPEHDWSVVETEVPANYKVKVERSGITFVITNSTGGSGGRDDDPDPTRPTPTEPAQKDVITDDDVPYGVLDIGDELIPLGLLPATGTLWWLVPILAAAGIFLFIFGVYRNRKFDGNEK